MNPSPAPTDFREGLNDPSPLTRVVALEWYDGLIRGVVELGSGGAEYQFSMLDEKTDVTDDSIIRVFGLRSLAPGTLDRITTALQDYLPPPNWPIWVPIWRFRSEADRVLAESAVRASLAGSGPSRWVVVAEVLLEPLRAVPIRAAKAF